jgi:hypothetical protein
MKLHDFYRYYISTNNNINITFKFNNGYYDTILSKNIILPGFSTTLLNNNIIKVLEIAQNRYQLSIKDTELEIHKNNKYRIYI